MGMSQSPTVRLLAGLFVILSAVALYSGYTVRQLYGLEHLQNTTIDRNRADSLLLLRIQNNLNGLALATRDMIEASEPYPLTAWQAQFRRIRTSPPLPRNIGTPSTASSTSPATARSPKRAPRSASPSRPVRKPSAPPSPACSCKTTRPNSRPPSASAASTPGCGATFISSSQPCWF